MSCISLNLELNLQGSQKIEFLQLQKFVLESLHQFEKQFLKDSEVDSEIFSFCESEREYKSLSLSRQIPIYENASFQGCTSFQNAQNDLVEDCTSFLNPQNRNESHNKNQQRLVSQWLCSEKIS